MQKRIVQSNEDEIYCLFSIDLKDSTKGKYENISWDNNLFAFYEKIPLQFEGILQSIDGSLELNLWKYVGDEILFYIRIFDYDQVSNAVIAFKKTLEFYTSRKDDKYIGIKGTVWLAQLNNIDKSFFPNKSKTKTDNNIDFVGPSIDCGFRLSKYSSEYYISASVEVIDLCKSNSKLQKSIYFLNPECLKGVIHGEREYPVFLIKLNNNSRLMEEQLLRESCNQKQLSNFLDYFYSEAIIKKFPWCISRITASSFISNLSNTNNRLYLHNLNNNITNIKTWFYSNFEDPANNCYFESKEGGYYFSDLGTFGNGHDCLEELIKEFSDTYSESDIQEAYKEIIKESSCYEWARIEK